MKRKYLATVGVVAMAVSGGALGAILANGSGQSCGDFIGTWHFINNQTGGAAAGVLTADFSSGQCVTGPSKVLANVQHFICTAAGSLISASTNLPGRLVLSDFTCKKEEDPPK